MNKKTLIIILTLLVIPIVYATVDLEISLDNATWKNVTEFGGQTDNVNSRGFVNTLHPNTDYYFRAKDSGTDWGYTEQRTDPGGINEMEIAIVLGLIVMLLIFIIIMIISEHIWFRILSCMFATGFAWVLYATMIQLAKDNSASGGVIDILTGGYSMMKGIFIMLYILILCFGIYSVMMKLIEISGGKKSG